MDAVQAVEHGGPGVLRSADLPRPEPGPGEVRVDVAAAAVNFRDVETRRGNYPDAPAPPFVPGIEVAGRVDAVGPGADRSPGERVAAVIEGGGYAGHALAPADRLFPVPNGLDLRRAAGYPVAFLTAHNALHEWGALAAGERVLVHAAAGGVGGAAVQLAARAGAEVFGTASTDAKLSVAADLGVDHPIDYTEADVAERVAAITDGAGVDLVLDGVGGEAFYAGLEALAPGGQVVAYGVAGGSVPTVSTPRLLFRNASVLGYHLGHALEDCPGRVRSAVPSVLKGLSGGDLSVRVDRQFPLAAAARAHERLEERHSAGKLLLVP